MRRSPLLLSAAALVLGLGACNDKITDSADDPAPERTTPELIPFDSTPLEPDETDPADTEPADSDLAADSDDTDDAAEEATDGSDATDAEVLTIDPLPGDTVAPDTRPEDDPLCEAAQAIVDLDEEYQEVLAQAVEDGADDPDALVRALRKLPLEDIRDAYDDLMAEVPENLRRRVAAIRDFTVEHGNDLAEVEDLEGLSQLVAEIEGDPDAADVTKATTQVSEYTEEECGIRIAQGG